MLFIVKALKKLLPSLVIALVHPPPQIKEVLLTARYISFVYFYLYRYIVIYNHI